MGNGAPLGSLDVSGPTSINTSSLKTLNTQNYQGPVLFSKNSTLEGSMITFNNTAGPSNPNAAGFLINGQSVDPASTGHSYSGSAVIDIGSVMAPPATVDVTVLTDPVVGQLSTNSLEESQCSTGDAACTSAENNEIISNESEGKIEVLIENPIPKTVAGTVFCMMGFATAIGVAIDMAQHGFVQRVRDGLARIDSAPKDPAIAEAAFPVHPQIDPKIAGQLFAPAIRSIKLGRSRLT